LYYALKIGLTVDEFLWLDYGMFMDLVSIEKIRHEGAKIKIQTSTDNYDEIVIPDIP